MSYMIQYSPQDAKRYPQNKKNCHIKFGKWVLPTLIIAAVLWMRLNGVPDFLVPGEPEQTKAAAADMMKSLRQGVNFKDAVTAFCQDIIYGTQE